MNPLAIFISLIIVLVMMGALFKIIGAIFRTLGLLAPVVHWTLDRITLIFDRASESPSVREARKVYEAELRDKAKASLARKHIEELEDRFGDIERINREEY